MDIQADREILHCYFLYLVSRPSAAEQNQMVCPKSPDGKHRMVPPRLEDSIDRDRGQQAPRAYCSVCYSSE